MGSDNRSFLTYRPDLDGLRAVAIIAVVIFSHFFSHAFNVNGGMGVDMFFVLSGYLITTIITRQWDQGTFRFREFYARRIRRLFPTLIVTFVATGIWGWFFLNPISFRLLGGTLAASGASVMNYLLDSGMEFFHITAKALPYGQLWSLSLEEQFYLIFPWVLIGMTRLSSLIRWRVMILMIVAVLSWIYYFKFEHLFGQTYYSPWARSWEILIGVCLALSWKNLDFLKSCIGRIGYRFWKSGCGASMVCMVFGVMMLASPMTADIVSLVGALTLIAVSLRLKNQAHKNSGLDLVNVAEIDDTFTDNMVMVLGLYLVLTGFFMPLHTYPVYVTAIFSTLGTALMIASGPNSWVNRRILSNSVLVYIGKLSYALYVIHHPVYILANLYHGHVVKDPILLCSLMLFSFISAVVVYHWVEKPTRRSGPVWLWLIAMLFCITMGYFAYNETIKPLTPEQYHEE